MTKPVTRTAIITVPLPDIARALGKKDWDSVNEYLDVDYYDFGSDYNFAKDVSKGSEMHIFAKYCPRILNRAYDYAYNSVISNDLSKQRRAWIEKAMNLIEITNVDYQGMSSKGESFPIENISAKIVSAECDGPNLRVEILNPEHLLNAIISGMGYFYPEEILADVALSENKLCSYFTSNIGDFFKVFSELPYSDFGSNVYPDNKEIKEFLKEMDMDDISSDIASKVVELIADTDKEQIESDLYDLEAFFRINGLAKDVFSEAKELIQSEQDRLNEIMKKVS